MRVTLLLLLISVISLSANAQDAVADDVQHDFSSQMDDLIAQKQQADRLSWLNNAEVPTNPYYHRLLLGGTLYNGAVNRMMGLDWTMGESEKRGSSLSLGVDYLHNDAAAIEDATDRQLAAIYVNHPDLITSTEEDLAREGGFHEGFAHPIEPKAKLAERAVPIDLGSDIEDPIEPTAKRPKFWTLKGSGSIQFSQNYYSDNWYQGGEKSYAELSEFTFEANFDNKQKILWENKLEVQLGFQTSTDTVHSIKVTNNLLRLTSNFGYQATKNWYYTASVVGYTQIMRYYDTNAYTYSTCFASPLDLTISVGMTYKFNTKRDIFSGSLLLSPIAYNMRYVGLDSLRSHYSVPEGKKAYHNFGPSATLNFTLVPCKNVTWESRLYYFTNLSYVDIEWENTFTFTINKYLSAKLFMYPRFDDSCEAYKGKHNYFMFKEWLSLGLSFDF